MRPRQVELGRRAAVLVLLAPTAVTAALVGMMLWEPPRHLLLDPTPPKLSPIGPLAVGDRRTVELPKDVADVDEVAAFLATYRTTPRATFDICAQGRCVTAHRRVDDDTMVFLPLPRGVRGGEVSVTLRALTEGGLAYWGTDGRPLIRGAQRAGWSGPWSHAGLAFRTLEGLGLAPLAILNALGLLTALGIACWRGFAERGS